jgi:putative ABC transport system ATP-binding protein
MNPLPDKICANFSKTRQSSPVAQENEMSTEVILDVRNLSRTYTSGNRILTVLDNVSFQLVRRETCAIVGPSGSGKTTLLGLCAGLDLPTSGSVTLNGAKLSELNENQRALLRNQHTGFVFQNFQLLPNLTALENVMIPVELRGERGAVAEAKQLLSRVGLGDRLNHYPAQLSGGEQQRVALARAFINRPHILFVDEPTGNLDAETAAKVVDLIFEMNNELDTALVLVTHDLELARRTNRILRLRGGRLVEDSATLVH